MTYLTKLTLQSGDRVVLDQTVSDIKQFVARKGAEMKGPHPRPPETVSVSLRKHLDGTAGEFPPWTYTVYTRDIEIVGHNDVAREVASRAFPSSLYVTIEVEHVGSIS